jgi:hypothetical protein
LNEQLRRQRKTVELELPLWIQTLQEIIQSLGSKGQNTTRKKPSLRSLYLPLKVLRGDLSISAGVFVIV